MKNGAMLILSADKGRAVKVVYRMGLPLLGAFLILLSFTLPAQAGVKSDRPRPAAARQHLLMDVGWRFALGNACDPSKDFATNTGYFSHFAKAGYGAIAYVNGLEVGRLNMRSPGGYPTRARH